MSVGVRREQSGCGELKRARLLWGIEESKVVVGN